MYTVEFLSPSSHFSSHSLHIFLFYCKILSSYLPSLFLNVFPSSFLERSSFLLYPNRLFFVSFFFSSLLSLLFPFSFLIFFTLPFHTSYFTYSIFFLSFSFTPPLFSVFLFLLSSFISLFIHFLCFLSSVQLPPFLSRSTNCFPSDFLPAYPLALFAHITTLGVPTHNPSGANATFWGHGLYYLWRPQDGHVTISGHRLRRTQSAT